MADKPEALAEAGVPVPREIVRRYIKSTTEDLLVTKGASGCVQYILDPLVIDLVAKDRPMEAPFDARSVAGVDLKKLDASLSHWMQSRANTDWAMELDETPEFFAVMKNIVRWILTENTPQVKTLADYLCVVEHAVHNWIRVMTTIEASAANLAESETWRNLHDRAPTFLPRCSVFSVVLRSPCDRLLAWLIDTPKAPAGAVNMAPLEVFKKNLLTLHSRIVQTNRMIHNNELTKWQRALRIIELNDLIPEENLADPKLILVAAALELGIAWEVSAEDWNDYVDWYRPAWAAATMLLEDAQGSVRVVDGHGMQGTRALIDSSQWAEMYKCVLDHPTASAEQFTKCISALKRVPQLLRRRIFPTLSQESSVSAENDFAIVPEWRESYQLFLKDVVDVRTVALTPAKLKNIIVRLNSGGAMPNTDCARKRLHSAIMKELTYINKAGGFKWVNDHQVPKAQILEAAAYSIMKFVDFEQIRSLNAGNQLRILSQAGDKAEALHEDSWFV